MGYEELNYEGELDLNGLPCGYGEATDDDDSTWTGFWMEGNIHGVCE